MKPNNGKMQTPNWASLALLRWFLAFLVAGRHLTDSVHDGTPYLLKPLDANTAVDVFFVISGFSMAASFSSQPDGFYRRRFWRVMPLYWTGLLLAYSSFIIFGPVIAEDFGSAWRFPGWPVFLTQALVLQPIWSSQLIPLNSALWSIGVEIAFYAAVPFLSRLRPQRVIMLVLASAILAISLERQVMGPTINVMMYAQCFWGFGAGWLFYKYRDSQAGRILLVAFLTAVVLLKGHKVEPLAWFLMLFGSATIAFNHRLRMSPSSEKIANYLGDLSFPLYALHWPVGWMLNFMNLNWPLQYAFPTAIVVSIVALHVVERPLRKLGRRSTAPGPAEDLSKNRAVSCPPPVRAGIIRETW